MHANIHIGTPLVRSTLAFQMGYPLVRDRNQICIHFYC